MARVWQESKLLARQSTIYATGTAMQQLAGFLLLPLYTSYLSPADYGIKELVTLSMDVISVFLVACVGAGIYRFYFNYEDPADRNAVISTAALAIGGVGLVLLPLAMLAVPAAARGLLDDPGTARYLRLALLALFFQSINSVAFTYLRATQRSVLYVGYSVGGLLLAIGLNVYFIVVQHRGLLGVFMSNAIVTAVTLGVLTAPILWRLRPVFDRAKLRELVRFGAPFVGSRLGTLVVTMSDRFFLKSLVSLSETGIYSLALRFGSLPATFISQPFNETWLARRFEIAREADSEKVFGRIFTYFVWAMTMAGLAVALLSQDVITLIAAPRFHAARQIVSLIVLSNILFTFQYHFQLGLLLTDHTKELAVVNVISGALVVGLNLVLIPRYGAAGAALSLIATNSIRNALVFLAARRYYRIHFESVRIAKVIAAAAAVYLAARCIETGTPALNLVLRGLSLLLLPVLAWLLRIPDPDEWARARQVLARLARRGAA